nr:basic helix-loop-helix transcription factor [Loropetalum chinense var. rubrum]
MTGFSVTRGTGNYNYQGGSNGGHGTSRLKPQLSFTRQDSALSQISEVSENVVENNGHRDASSHSYATPTFGMDSWDNTNSIVFSGPPCKRANTNTVNGDILNCLSGIESQFSLPQTSLEMATVEKLLQIPEDSVPCKIRARRGFATHPRSIAERERRTRISGKLKKLQDLVPNMDKQTSYADMLDLAVKHIKGLQQEVQNLNKDLENCTCGCKQQST